MHRTQVKAASAEQIPCRTCGGQRKEKIGKSETISQQHLLNLKGCSAFNAFNFKNCTEYIDIGVVDGLIRLSSWQQAARRKHRKITKQSRKVIRVYRLETYFRVDFHFNAYIVVSFAHVLLMSVVALTTYSN